MKCEKCGSSVEDRSAKVCPSCGAPVSQMEQAAEAGTEEIATPDRRWSARIFDIWLGSIVMGILHELAFPNLQLAVSLRGLPISVKGFARGE